MLMPSLKIAKLYDCSSYGHNIEHNGLSYEHCFIIKHIAIANDRQKFGHNRPRPTQHLFVCAGGRAEHN